MNGNTITGPQYGETRDMPWDVMGTSLKPSSATNLSKALADAGLDYTVETWNLAAFDPSKGRSRQKPLDASRNQAIVRPMPDGSMAVVGVTGTRFTPIQNADAFAIATDLVGDFGARIEGLADFRHGGASVMALSLPDQAVRLVRPDGGEDVTALNLLVKNAHDGSSALTFAITPVRLACTNVLPMAFRKATRTWKMAHTPNAGQRLEVARQAILEAVGFHDALQVTAQKMMDTPMVDAEFAKIVANVFPVDPVAVGKVADRRRDTQQALVNLYQTSPTLEGVRGTVWGGYNAMTEYLDHFRPVKGTGDAAKVARAEGQIDGPNVRAKARMWDLFSRVAA